jgi:mannose-6-phosphate isomerase-like protein (cupin superfamily)
VTAILPSGAISVPIYPDRDALRHRGALDAWTEIDDVEFLTLGPADEVWDGSEPAFPTLDAVETPELCAARANRVAAARRIAPGQARQRLFVLAGQATIQCEYGRATLQRNQWLDLPAGGGLLVNGTSPTSDGWRPPTDVLRIAGRWGETVGIGIFRFGPSMPCDYHYHDGDEYWFIYRGHFMVRYEGSDYPMGPGSVLAAGMGEEHGVLAPGEVFEGVSFRTQLEGRKRPGHLWRNVHGEPEKRQARGATYR